MIGRVLRTVVHLQPSQAVGQMLARLHRASPRCVPVPRTRVPAKAWVDAAPKVGCLAGPHTFCSLNTTYDFPYAGDWDRADRLFLWKYNLHYFDYLNSDHGPEHRAWARHLIGRWIVEHPDGIGWEPYPTSLRLCNWIRHHWETEPLPADAIASLARQADQLFRSVEYHIGANHLFTNAKALAFAGTFFEGPAAERWWNRGIRLLQREIPRQFLPDGGHYERSPMYHAILLEDLLDLANLFSAMPAGRTDAIGARLAAAITGALGWMRRMTVADGLFPLFGDSARGIAPTIPELFDYARRLGIPEGSEAQGNDFLADSGFVRLEPAERAVLFATVDGPKPAHQPGHSHADTLAFELYVQGRATLVDGGVPTYERGHQRLQSRGTSMHNTLQIGAADSSEVWSSFRVGRRARVLNPRWDDTARTTFTATHDGYRALPGRPLHTRTWRAAPGVIHIDDSLSGDRPQPVTIRFRAGPGLRWVRRPAAPWLLVDAGRTVIRLIGDPKLEYRVVSAPYHPEFNAPATIEVLEASGTMSPGMVCSHAIEIPAAVVPGSAGNGSSESPS